LPGASIATFLSVCSTTAIKSEPSLADSCGTTLPIVALILAKRKIIAIEPVQDALDASIAGNILHLVVPASLPSRLSQYLVDRILLSAHILAFALGFKQGLPASSNIFCFGSVRLWIFTRSSIVITPRLKVT
jgi:hypothetical protein